SLSDAGVDLRNMMAGRLREDARPGLDAAALGIARAVVEPPDACEGDGCCAHRAWLQGDIEAEAGEPLGTYGAAGLPNDQYFRVCRRVGQLARTVAGAGDHHAVGRNDHRTPGNLAPICRTPGFLQRE